MFGIGSKSPVLLVVINRTIWSMSFIKHRLLDFTKDSFVFSNNVNYC